MPVALCIISAGRGTVKSHTGMATACRGLDGGAPSGELPEAAPPFVCDPEIGITLPEGFCGVVFARNVGRARHLVVNDNGDGWLDVEVRGVARVRRRGGGGRVRVKSSRSPRLCCACTGRPRPHPEGIGTDRVLSRAPGRLDGARGPYL